MRFQKRSCATHLPEGLPCKSDKTMFLPAGKAMYLCHNEPSAVICLRRDIAFAVILSSTVIFAFRASYSSLKRREFDEIVFFSAGSEKPSVLAYTIFQVLPKKQNIANSRRFYKKNFGRACACSPRRLPEIISKCYDCGNTAC